MQKGKFWSYSRAREVCEHGGRPPHLLGDLMETLSDRVGTGLLISARYVTWSRRGHLLSLCKHHHWPRQKKTLTLSRTLPQRCQCPSTEGPVGCELTTAGEVAPHRLQCAAAPHLQHAPKGASRRARTSCRLTAPTTACPLRPYACCATTQWLPLC